ncbi:hypothetical protein LCGC14_2006970 [marine sediment metagenome]|uniref:DUF2281 domain-containing protein n=1 Tax=marine sediment metagenome TaxID=412755 RepID=A0A0F9HYI5_9ZZZZ|nr:MAG: hypothetical protein Lokiarch_26090 [Candidatus Lokiarchaeum sp. GC14_75]
MSKKDTIISELNNLTESLIDEILEHIIFLKNRSLKEKRELILMSESSLSKDWLKPEEDKAWQDL